MEQVDESETTGAHCTGCGRGRAACDGCGRLLDPPRFCGSCGRRLTVRVTPAGYAARCRDHGPTPAAAGGGDVGDSA